MLNVALGNQRDTNFFSTRGERGLASFKKVNFFSFFFSIPHFEGILVLFLVA